MKIKLSLLSTLLFISINLYAENNANQLLDQVRNDFKSMSADFKQYDIDDNGLISEVITGKMWLKAPNQFKWEYIEPAPQLIVSDGQKVWIYDEDLDQVTIKKQDSTQDPIYVLLNKELTEKKYSVENWQVDGETNDIDWVSLTPKIANNEANQVWVGIANNNIQVIKFKNQFDNMVVFEFNQIIKNTEFSIDFFTFTPPDGIDIISDVLVF